MNHGIFHDQRLYVALALFALLVLLSGCSGFNAPLSTARPIPSAAPTVAANPQQVGQAIERVDRQVRFEHLSITEGLSESVVRAILQDQDGFLWFATDDGLNRFDGYDFVVYKNDPTNLNSLSHSQTYRLMEDRQGNLWVGTGNYGLTHFDRAAGRFTRYLPDPQRADALPGGRVTALLEDTQGVIWVGTNAGLARYDPQTDAFRRYQRQEDDANSISSNSITSLAEDVEGALWVGTGKGLNLFDPVSEQFTHYFKQAENNGSLANDAVITLHVDHQGSLWVGTWDGGLDRFDPETGQFVHYAFLDRKIGGVGGAQLSSILQSRDGVLWIGLTGGGLCRLLPDRDALECYKSDPTDSGSLSAMDVISLYEDRSGILWVGTYGGGVNKMDPAYRPFETLRSDPRNTNSLSNGLVFGLLKDPQGYLWVGTAGGGLDRVDRASGQVTHFRHHPADKTSLGSDQVHVLYRDAGGTLWVGSDAGLSRMDPGADHFVNIMAKAEDPEGLNDNIVLGIGEDAQGNLWVATREALQRMDRKTGHFQRYKNIKGDPTSLAYSPLTSLLIDSEGQIWVGTMNTGIERFDPRTETFTHFNHDPEDPRTISDVYVLSIYEDSQGTLWVGTTSGLNRFDRASGTFRQYHTKDGLPNDYIYAILEDKLGQIWISTNKGLSRFDWQKGKYKNFDARDGLQSNEFNMGAACAGEDGELFFGGINGVTAFHPEEIRDNPYIPPVVLTSLTQHGETLPVDPGSAGEVSVRWPDNYFDFEFAALNYTRPENNQYAYMLEGFDRDWNQIGARRSGRYTNLPGGVYTLRLKGSNNDGLWNEAGATLVVRIIPPFWATWWFRGASVLLLVGLVTGTVRMRVRGVELRNRELERMVHARTAEIEQLYEQTKELAVVQERNRLARDLHDSAKQKAFAALAQIGAASGLSRGEPQRAHGALAEAETLVYEVIEDLTFLIQDMYPAALQEKGLPNMAREYLYEWEARNDIQVAFQIENERLLALQVEQALYRILQEALANVARHSRATRVDVQICYLPEEVTIAICDNGQGFDITRCPAGVGLRSMRERITLVGGELTLESAPGKGTRLLARAPARKAREPRQSEQKGKES